MTNHFPSCVTCSNRKYNNFMTLLACIIDIVQVKNANNHLRYEQCNNFTNKVLIEKICRIRRVFTNFPFRWYMYFWFSYHVIRIRWYMKILWHHRPIKSHETSKFLYNTRLYRWQWKCWFFKPRLFITIVICTLVTSEE